MKKKVIIFSILALLVIAISYALTTELITPADNTYFLYGPTTNINTTFFYVNASPVVQNMTDNCSVFSNISGTWTEVHANTTNGTAGGKTTYIFTPQDLDVASTDNTDFIWNAFCCDNASVANCAWASSNRTVHVEEAPIITLNLPSDGNYEDSSSINLNFSVTGDSDSYTCYYYVNDTGNFSAKGSLSTATNNTEKSVSKTFDDGHFIWNVLCYESGTKYPNVYGWSASNYSVIVDTVNPSISINTPADNYNSSSNQIDINFTVTEANPLNCSLYVDGAANQTTVATYTSGSPVYLQFNATEGDYVWNVLCNDSAGNEYQTDNRSLTVDTTYPYIGNQRNYSGTRCDGWIFEFNSSEQVNYTINYGTDVDADNTTITSTSYLTNHSNYITFNWTYEETYYINITMCDRAGNCNSTSGTDGIDQISVVSPVPVCSGWNLWSIYDTSISLSKIYNDSGVDYVYWWNSTGEAWKYYTSTYTDYADNAIGIGDVAFLYDSDSTTWFRNFTTTPAQNYTVNITSGHNFLGLYYPATFADLSYGNFLNESSGNRTLDDDGTGSTEFLVEFYNSYNNSNQEYASYIYEWRHNNATELGRYMTSLDILHVYSPDNLSLNITSPGHGFVYGNWT